MNKEIEKMSNPKIENIENLWRNIEGPPPSIPFKLEENLNAADFMESDEGSGENPFEGTSYGPPGTEPYDDPFENSGDLADYDAEVEIINLNKRVSREFSLSHYDVNIHEFGRLRAKYANTDGDSSQEWEDLQSRELIQNGEYDSGELINDNGAAREINHVHDYEGSNDGTESGHLICDCEDCINQTEAVECQCENCVQTGEIISHTPPPGEATCDCDDCLNNSAESYSCDCENCRTGQKVLNNNKPDETCKCENCLGPNGDGDYSGEVCLCEKCCEEDELTYHVNGSDKWGPERFRGLRGSPQGSSQQFDLPRIEEVDQLEEEKHSFVNDINNEYANDITNEYANHVNNEYANTNKTEKFANELFTKLEKVKLNGGEKQENTKVLNKKSFELSDKQKPKHEHKDRNVFSKVNDRNVFSKNKGRNVFSKQSKDKQLRITDSENQCSNCEVDHSLHSDCTVAIDDHTDHGAFRGRSDCDCRECSSPSLRGHNPGFPPPRGHNHVLQPLAVKIGG